jgi:hypothetical protein
MAIRSELIALLGALLTAPAAAGAQTAPDEAALIARHTDLVRRSGPVLELRTDRGWERLESSDCAATPDSCVVYTLDRVWAGQRLFGIRLQFYEGVDYMVIAAHGGGIQTGARPAFAPAGGFFASAFSDQTRGDGGWVRLWRVGDEQPVRMIGTGAGEPADLVWHGDACLSFTVTGGGPLGGRAADDRKRWYLHAARPEWRLSERRPAACR